MNRQLSELEKNMLIESAKKMIILLEKEKEACNVSETAFQYFSDDNKEVYQIQMLVTRREYEFIDLFDVVVTNSY